MEAEKISTTIRKEFFYFFSFLLFLLLFLEIILQGIVSVYLNFNLLVIVWFLSAVSILKTKKC